MNDDFDLDALLRAGARAFPAAPTPDSARLRDVLTTSRRRSRRTQGSVLACATAAVAGGAALALREPEPTESVEVAGPETTSPDPITQASILPGSPLDWDTPIRDLLCTPDSLAAGAVPEDAQVLIISSGPDWQLPGPVTVTFDGETVSSSEPDVDSLLAFPLDPLWTLLMGPDEESPVGGNLLMVMAPFETPGPHEISITAAGKTGTLQLVSDPDGSTGVVWALASEEYGDLFASMDGQLDIAWSRLGDLCAGLPPADVGEPDTTTSTPPTTSETLPSTTAGPPTTAAQVTAPLDGPSAPTTSTVPQPPAMQSTTVPLSVPPTTAPDRQILRSS